MAGIKNFASFLNEKKEKEEKLFFEPKNAKTHDRYPYIVKYNKGNVARKMYSTSVAELVKFGKGENVDFAIYGALDWKSDTDITGLKKWYSKDGNSYWGKQATKDTAEGKKVAEKEAK